MVFKNTKELNNSDLLDFLKKHLLVYSKWDSEKECEVIDYIALAKIPEEHMRSQTMSLAPRDNSRDNVSKKNLIKSRANARRGPHDDSTISILEQNSSRQSQTISNRDNKPLSPAGNSVEISSRDSQWEELTR